MQRKKKKETSAVVTVRTLFGGRRKYSLNLIDLLNHLD